MLKEAVAEFLKGLDLEDSPHTKDTPQRVERLWKEVLWGVHTPRPAMTTFLNDQQVDQLMTIGPIQIHSCCSHHLVPVIGQAWIGYLPGNHLLGLSKFHRLAQWMFARPTDQESATKQLGDDLVELLSPLGLGVVVRAEHYCVKWRGVKGDGTFVTSDVRGLLRENAAARQEFMMFVKGQGF